MIWDLRWYVTKWWPLFADVFFLIRCDSIGHGTLGLGRHGWDCYKLYLAIFCYILGLLPLSWQFTICGFYFYWFSSFKYHNWWVLRNFEIWRQYCMTRALGAFLIPLSIRFDKNRYQQTLSILFCYLYQLGLEEHYLNSIID